MLPELAEGGHVGGIVHRLARGSPDGAPVRDWVCCRRVKVPPQTSEPELGERPAPSDDDDESPRAPAGTWASDGSNSLMPTSPDQSSDRLVRPSRPPPPKTIVAEPALPGPPPTGVNRIKPKAASGSASASPITAQPTVAKPPFLASVLMRKRDELRDPICIKRGRVLSLAGGLGAAVAAFASGSAAPSMIALGMLAVMLAVSGLVPVPEPRRPWLALGLGLGVVVLGLLERRSMIGATATIGALTAAGGLILRGKRTRSWTARVLVGVGMVAATGWLGTLGVRGTVAASFGLLDVLGPLLAITLLIVVALVLLAFLDEHGPSGAGYIGTAFLAWAALEAVIAAWSAGFGSWGAGALAAALALPATAIAIAQVLGGQVLAPLRIEAREPARGDG